MDSGLQTTHHTSGGDKTTVINCCAFEIFEESGLNIYTVHISFIQLVLENIYI